MINLSHIRDLTIEYGEGWAYFHVCRVQHLIEEIGTGLVYDKNATMYAAYLHDWGAFPHYHLAGVDHALRSMQVAEKEILPFTTIPDCSRQLVLEAISLHDFRDTRPAFSTESLLLREADMLDMLGVVGILREFAWGPNDLQACYQRVMARRMEIAGKFTLPIAKKLAGERVASMDQVLAQFHHETFGLF
jgi:uncharacterized protein